MEILNELNPEQLAAATHENGAALVLAGAGSGKTRVLTTRAAWLIKEKKVAPESILLVTFTNKAAGEMNTRLEDMTGYRLPFSGTFHSLCAKILRRDGIAMGLAHNFIIYDSDDQLALLKDIYKQYGFSSKEINPRAAKAEISTAKNKMIDHNLYAETASGNFQQKVAEIYSKYEHHLRNNQALDFDDLLIFAVNLLKKYPTIREKYQKLIEYVMVDEYQDTNKVQYQLTKILAAPQNNLFVVGDFSQSIYAWRGADYRNMNFLKQDFPDLKEYRLEQNYRSTQAILKAATKVISQNDQHPILELWTENTVSEPILCHEANTSDEEAQYVIKQITNELSDLYELRDCVILYRTNAQSRSFEEACMNLGVPYKLIGGFKFYERKEIKDVLAYLKFSINRNDTVSEARASKLGKRNFKHFELWLAEQKQLAQMTPYEFLHQIIEVTGYKQKYDPADPEQATRLENIQELLNVASQFTDVNVFLENIALVQDNYMTDAKNEEVSDNAVTLMSLHSAKGLEFPVVFLVGMEEGLLPHSRSMFDKEQMEEERRLCYVGITRAKEKLYFTHARSRWQYGSSTQSSRSRFIQDVPKDIIDFSQSKNWDQPRYKAGFKPEYQNYTYNNFKMNEPKPKKPKGRVIIDDDELDALLDGEIDLDTFISN